MEDPQLVQMQALSRSVEAVIERSNQLSKTLEQTSSTLEQTIQRMEAKIAAFEIANRALMKSLEDSDRTVDDLVKIVTALLQFQKRLEASLNQQQSVPSAP